MKNPFFSWDEVGTVLAAAAVGYVVFTVAQVVPVATPDDLTTTAVAEPPRPRTASTGPASTDGPSVVEPAEASPGAASEIPTPSSPAERLPTPEPSARPPRVVEPTRVRSPAPAREAAASATQLEPKQQLEVKHALRADRQLAAMLRGTLQISWITGSTWVTPVVDYRLTARFGEVGRLWASTHTGLDFAAPTGTPVRAATAGTVVSVSSGGAYGTKIEISHPDGSETWYAHLSRTDVQVGSQVDTGTLIGAVGATGNVTGPHLHFEVRPDGDGPVDPELALHEQGVST